ncbi:YdgA family protein [Vogesella sp. LIG4]|uniref:YdgA family protein n=1 Tax=Vogesella sp. LIG4 TaxID=1192162 RepID=UPI001E447B70|nr:YdgA family protein [Vogesella sp. LIG4]
MNVSKHRLILGGGALVATFALYSGFAYWAGIKAEETLAEQHRMIAQSPVFTIKSHSYQRGWFSSEETTELELNKQLVGPYLALLPENLRPLFSGTLRYHHKVKHGLLPGLFDFDLRPARAIVRTEFDMSEGTRKTLQRFFGDAEPITVINRLGLTGGGELTVTVPKFDYEETLAGVKMNWQGFNLKVDYRSGYREYNVESTTPGFVLQAGPKGRFAFDGIKYQSEIRPGATGVKLGTSALSVDDIKLNWNEAIPYSIKLNELIYLVSRVRVGEFINPSGEFRPSRVELSKLAYQIVTSEQDEYVNTRGKLDFDRFAYNDSVYGPLKLDVSANHLHGPTLVKLDAALSKLPFEGKDPSLLRKRYIDTIMQQGLPLLKNDPKLLLNTFYLRMPNGEVKANGSLALAGLQDADMKDPISFLKRFNAQASIELPEQTLQNLVVAQARNLFTVDASAEEQPNMAEVESLAKSLLAAQLGEWEQQHLIKRNGGQLATSLHFASGELRVNQQKVNLPWQESDEPAPDAAASAAK